MELAIKQAITLFRLGPSLKPALLTDDFKIRLEFDRHAQGSKSGVNTNLFSPSPRTAYSG
jgi:hypothetical protein